MGAVRAGPGHLPTRLSEDLRNILEHADGKGVTIGKVVEILRGRGLDVLVIVLALPFCTPIPLPGLSTPFGLVLMFFAEYFIFTHSGPYHAAIVETVPVNMRSMAFALTIFIIHAFGDAVSPFLLGVVSDARGLSVAIFLSMLYLVLGGVTSILAGEAYEKDFHGGTRKPEYDYPAEA